MSRNDNVNAFADFTKAIQIDPNEAEAYYNRAVIQNSRKNYIKAIADYDKYISLNTSNIAYLADGYLNRGIVYFDTGDLTQALKDISAAVDLAPNDPKTYKARAIIYRKQNKIELAVVDERKAASLTK